MFHADKTLALRLEGAAIAIEGAYARSHARISPDRGIGSERFADGQAVFGGLDSPLSQVTGFGLSREVSTEDFSAVEDFYDRRNAPTRIVTCPMVDDSFLALLTARGYGPQEVETTLVRLLDDASPAPPPLEIREIGHDEADLYADTVGVNFMPDGILPPDFREMMRAMFGVELAHSLVAYVDGEPAGGGALLMTEGLAMLAGAGTLPKFRNRGIQNALLAERLRRAKAAGCDLAVMGARPGSASQRNSERNGFRVAYTKTVFFRPARS